MSEPTLAYDKTTRKGVITFPNGHRLTIGNVEEAQAQDFFRKHAAEFQKRDCVLHSSACIEKRSEDNA